MDNEEFLENVEQQKWKKPSNFIAITRAGSTLPSVAGRAYSAPAAVSVIANFLMSVVRENIKFTHDTDSYSSGL